MRLTYPEMIAGLLLMVALLGFQAGPIDALVAHCPPHGDAGDASGTVLRNGTDCLASDEDLEDLDRETKGYYSIKGTIRDGSREPMPGIHVLLMGDNGFKTDYTDQFGFYQFANVKGGTRYTVIPNSYEYIPVIDDSSVTGDEIVAIAEAELGNTDGFSPGRYHGHGGGWCSEFASWCYWRAGEPFVGGATDGGSCVEAWNMSTTHRIAAGFGRSEIWQLLSIAEINSNWPGGVDYSLEPQPGDYVFFSNATGIDRSHSGLVRQIRGADMDTIEGNVSNLVQALTRPNWRTYQSGNTVVKAIGYRRIVSDRTFHPRFYYLSLNSPATLNFTLLSAWQNECVASATNLCLNQSRFRVEVEWRDFRGITGVGQVVPIGSEDSGLFWFFDANNWEMLVKVLNGCAVNDHYWIFAAATTNVEYTLRVTDMETATVREYFNPLGTAAPSITDSSALATCP